MIDIERIKEMIDLMLLKKVNEISITEGESSVKITLNAASPSHIHEAVTHSNPPVIITTQKEKPAINTEETSRKQYVIKSPMVGTFYSKPSPTSKPFVEAGQYVKTGDVVCIVEAMKMFNQIECEQAGHIVSCLVKEGQPVEFDQPLFALELIESSG